MCQGQSAGVSIQFLLRARHRVIGVAEVCVPLVLVRPQSCGSQSEVISMEPKGGGQGRLPESQRSGSLDGWRWGSRCPRPGCEVCSARPPSGALRGLQEVESHPDLGAWVRRGRWAGSYAGQGEGGGGCKVKETAQNPEGRGAGEPCAALASLKAHIWGVSGRSRVGLDSWEATE